MLASLALSAILSTTPAIQDQPVPTKLDFKIVGATVYKNCYAVVAREAAVPSSGDYVLDDLPTPAAGTMWITSTAGTTIQSVIHGTDMREITAKIGDIDQLLVKNVGKVVTLTLKDLPPIKGKIVSAAGSLVVLYDLGNRSAVPKSTITSLSSKEA